MLLLTQCANRNQSNHAHSVEYNSPKTNQKHVKRLRTFSFNKRQQMGHDYQQKETKQPTNNIILLSSNSRRIKLSNSII